MRHGGSTGGQPRAQRKTGEKKKLMEKDKLVDSASACQTAVANGYSAVPRPQARLKPLICMRAICASVPAPDASPGRLSSSGTRTRNLSRCRSYTLPPPGAPLTSSCFLFFQSNKQIIDPIVPHGKTTDHSSEARGAPSSSIRRPHPSSLSSNLECR